MVDSKIRDLQILVFRFLVAYVQVRKYKLSLIISKRLMLLNKNDKKAYI